MTEQEPRPALLLDASSTTADELANDLRERIFQGTLAPGTPLSEKALASDYGLSRTPVREALGALASQGWVTRAANRSATVQTVSLLDVQELYPVIAHLETIAYEMTPPGSLNLSHLASLAERMKIVDPSTGGRESSQLDFDFHSALVHGCGNAQLIRVYDRARHSVRWFENVYFNNEILRNRSVHEHHDLLTIVSRGDVSEVGTAIRKHWAESLSRMLSMISEQTQPTERG